MDDHIEFKLQKGAKFNRSVKAKKIINNVPQAPIDIPQHPATPLTIQVGTVNSDTITLDVYVNNSPDPDLTWHFTYESTAPQSVCVTIGEN